MSNEVTQTDQNKTNDELDKEIKLAKIKAGSEAMSAIGGAVQTIFEVHKHCVDAREKTERMRIWSDNQLRNMAEKVRLSEMFLTKTFEQRDKSLSKNFEVLDMAMKNGDIELIKHSMINIANIVSESPLENFESFVKLFNDESQKLLDF